MTDLLFSTEPTPPTELQAARARYAEAQKVYDETPADSADFFPGDIYTELLDARQALREAEARELERLKQ